MLCCLDQQGKRKFKSAVCYFRLVAQSEVDTFIPFGMLAVEDGCSQTLLRLPETDSANKLGNDMMNSERGIRISLRLIIKHPNVRADFCWKLSYVPFMDLGKNTV